MGKTMEKLELNLTLTVSEFERKYTSYKFDDVPLELKSLSVLRLFGDTEYIGNWSRMYSKNGVPDMIEGTRNCLIKAGSHIVKKQNFAVVIQKGYGDRVGFVNDRSYASYVYFDNCQIGSYYLENGALECNACQIGKLSLMAVGIAAKTKARVFGSKVEDLSIHENVEVYATHSPEQLCVMRGGRIIVSKKAIGS